MTDSEGGRLIQAMGMFWQRSLVDWAPGKPRLLGQQVEGSQPIDFADQVGVYLLYDSREVIYVGQVLDRPLAKRLREHVSDRLNGRWDRFSWFGLSPVEENGKVKPATEGWPRQVALAEVVDVMEAILIEAVEPRQNRQRGYDLREAEYLQVSDPEVERQQFANKVLEKLTR